jgi:7,8-dihydropterin-6-yl-methyl-4-(beta-D-ribofuranosyl)aminobenzene 5'-phosphate synthase
MQIRILFDKASLDKSLYTGWGISFLIDNQILFDTGENGEWLINNLQRMRVDINRIQAIAISHDHWDHTGGLWEILKRRQLKVYGCPNFSAEFKSRVKHAGSEFSGLQKLTKVSEGIFLSGEILGSYAGADIAEQAVIIKTEKGVSVLTGCSHPGVIKILERVKIEFPEEKLYTVAGGFHLLEQGRKMAGIVVEQFKKMQVSKAGPTHCSGPEAEKIFKAEYNEDFIPVKVGQTIEV